RHLHAAAAAGPDGGRRTLHRLGHPAGVLPSRRVREPGPARDSHPDRSVVVEVADRQRPRSPRRAARSARRHRRGERRLRHGQGRERRCRARRGRRHLHDRSRRLGLQLTARRRAACRSQRAICGLESPSRRLSHRRQHRSRSGGVVRPVDARPLACGRRIDHSDGRGTAEPRPRDPPSAMRADLREAIRGFWADPGFSLVVVLTLALAIGMNSAIFSVLSGVLLRPLDYADPGRLVVLWESNPLAGQPQSETSAATYLDWRGRSHTIQGLGAFRHRGFTLRIDGESEHIASVEASPAIFRVLGVSPIVGRVFTDEEEQPGHERLAILSYGAWQRRFAGRSDAVGRTLELDGQPYEVVGVMPKTFQLPARDREVEVWSPLTLDLQSLLTRPHRMYRTIGRLAGGATIAQAQGEMDGIARDLAREHPETNAGWGVRLVRGHDQVVGDIGVTLWTLFGAVVLVLLIACA